MENITTPEESVIDQYKKYEKDLIEHMNNSIKILSEEIITLEKDTENYVNANTKKTHKIKLQIADLRRKREMLAYGKVAHKEGKKKIDIQQS